MLSMLTSDNIDNHISIALALVVFLIGSYRLKNPLPTRPGVIAKTPEEQRDRAMLLMTLGAIGIIYNVFRLCLY